MGLVEYAGFARTIDPRIATRCLCCPPPDEHPQDYVCSWEFTLADIDGYQRFDADWLSYAEDFETTPIAADLQT